MFNYFGFSREKPRVPQKENTKIESYIYQIKNIFMVLTNTIKRKKTKN